MGDLHIFLSLILLLALIILHLTRSAGGNYYQPLTDNLDDRNPPREDSDSESSNKLKLIHELSAALEVTTRECVGERDSLYEGVETNSDGEVLDSQTKKALDELDAIIDQAQEALSKGGYS